MSDVLKEKFDKEVDNFSESFDFSTREDLSYAQKIAIRKASALKKDIEILNAVLCGSDDDQELKSESEDKLKYFLYLYDCFFEIYSIFGVRECREDS